MHSGRVALEVRGLFSPCEVWLIDNRSGPGTSTLADEADRVVLAGQLPAGDVRAQLTVDFPALAPDGFELDRIVVVRPGAGAQGQVLLTGALGTFERLYARERAGRFGEGEVALVIARLHAGGKRLFEQETFAGNGRNCATCHSALNNFTIDPTFIATLRDDDPLFVAERIPGLAELENSPLLRARGIVLETLDGFHRPGVLRGVPPMLALATSVTGPAIPFDNTANPAFGIMPPAERTGWSGDGSLGSGALREFAMGR